METGSSGSTGGGSGNTGTRHDPHLQRKIVNSANSVLNDDVFAGHSDKSASLRAPPPPSQTAGSLPAQYARVRAARRMFMRATQLNSISGFSRQPAPGYPDGIGHFDVQGDLRQLACQNVHNIKERSNFSMSLDPAKLECLACTERHLFIRNDNPACIVAADQNFSPLLPAKIGLDCIGVIRVEDGSLAEITALFRDVFRNYTRPAGCLPPGSIILLGSISHLAMNGLQQYVEDLVRYLAIISSEVGGGAIVIPYVPIPLAGITSEELLRDMIDLDSWITGSGLGDLYTLQATRALFWDTLGLDASVVIDGGCRTLFLPANAKNPRKQRFVAGSVCHPASLDPVGEEKEAVIVTCLIGELSSLLSLKLDPSPDFARGGAAPNCELAMRRVAYLGASHTKRMSALAAAGGSTTGTLLPRWASDRNSVTIIAETVANLNLGKNDVLVADIFSNMVFMGTTEDGLAVWPFRGEDGVFHVQGNLEIASASILKKNLTAILPILDVAKNAKIVFVLPIPRYVTNSCCADPAHIANLDEDEFQAVVAGAGTAVRAVVEAELTKTNWDFSLYDPMSAFDEADSLAETVSSAGLSIWGLEDAVHLTNTAYKDVYGGLQDHIGKLAATDGPERRRRDSIVPTARPTPAAPTVQTPAWIKGEERPSWGGDNRRGSWPRGRAGRRGRRGPWRPY